MIDVRSEKPIIILSTNDQSYRLMIEKFIVNQHRSHNCDRESERCETVAKNGFCTRAQTA